MHEIIVHFKRLFSAKIYLITTVTTIFNDINFEKTKQRSISSTVPLLLDFKVAASATFQKLPLNFS